MEEAAKEVKENVEIAETKIEVENTDAVIIVETTEIKEVAVFVDLMIDQVHGNYFFFEKSKSNQKGDFLIH